MNEEREGFASPEEAALAQRSAAAEARVVSVEVRGPQAEVLLHVGTAGYPDYVACYFTPSGWMGGSSGNGHVVVWEDDET